MSMFFGFESLCEVAFENPATYGRPPASSAFIGMSHLRSCSFALNENVEQIFNVGQTTLRKPDKAVKGTHEVTGSLEFWLPDDLDGTCADDVFLIKAGLDAYNVAHDGSKWVIPNTGTSVYGSQNLPSLTLEIGHAKSGAERCHQITGCVADSFAVSASKGEKVTFTLSFTGKVSRSYSTDYINGAATRATARPLGWHNCVVEYGDDNATYARDDVTALEFTFENNTVKNYTLAESSFLIEDCDDNTTFTAADEGSLADNTTTFKQGIGSISFAKSGTVGTTASMTQTITAVDLQGKKIKLWAYIADNATLTALDVSAAAKFRLVLGTGGYTNVNYYDFATSLAVGWNEIIKTIDSPDAIGGSGADETAIDRLKLTYEVDTSGTEIAADKVLIDHIRIIEPRSIQNVIVGRQDISGTMTVNLTTTSGMAFYDALLNDSSAPYTPAESVKSKEILFKIRNNSSPAAQYIQFRLRDTVIGEIPMDIDPEKVQELSIPFTAQYYEARIGTTDSSAPTNFDLQS